MSNYPVGATWKAVDKDDKNATATIWLDRIEGKIEVWRYECNQSNWRNAQNSDWATSYRMAKQMCPINGRFKRIK